MKRITIYDKGKEMAKANNVRYAQECECTDSFDGVCRFEMNLNSKEQICKALNVDDTSLMAVLSSMENPILDYVTELVSPSLCNAQVSDKKSYVTMLILQDNDYDLAKVEARMREFHPRGTSISKVMQPFRQALEAISPNNNTIYETLIAKLS